MKKIIGVFFLLLFFIGCSKNSTILTPASSSTGSMTLKIDPHSVPAGVISISAQLTRTGFTTITQNLNLLSDSTADVTISSVQIGTWHLKVDAKDINGTILYTGETDVLVQENIVVQLNLTLNPVTSGTGTIDIFVTWGTYHTSQWIDYEGNPILTRNNCPSNPNVVSSAKILYDNGIYKMWYEGVYNSAVGSIWYAESQNGIHWNTIGSIPVLSKGDYGSWDSYSVIISSVIKVGNIYKMYYTGHKDYFEDLRTGVAISTDGINWTKYSTPIIGSTPGYYNFNFTDMVLKDSIYYGYFCYTTSNNTTDNAIIGVGTSHDGLFWERQVVLSASLPWENNSIAFPSVIYDKGIFRMIYQNTIGTSFGTATSSDGVHFTKADNPIFTQSNTIDNQSIWYPNYRKIDSVSYLYYTGSDKFNNLSIRLARNFSN